MKYRPFGRTGFEVSEIGFGTWGLGGDSYGPIEDDQSIRCLHAALDRGIKFFDTSDLYGSGHSEAVLGDAFVGNRSKVILATKGGLLPHDTFTMPTDFTPDYLRRALDASLRRLRTDYVDLYQLHSPELDYLRAHPEIFDLLEAFRREGKARAIGLSARSPHDAMLALDLFPFDAVQANYNLIDHRVMDDGLLDHATNHGVAIIARTPLCFGYLTGRLSGKREFVGKDHRANWPDDQLARWASAPGLFNHLYERRGCTPAQLALLFSIAPGTVATTIPGMMRVSEVDENVAASDLPPLTAEELDEIVSIYRNITFFDNSAKSRGVR